MKKLFLLIALFIGCNFVQGQTIMNVYKDDGTTLHISISIIDSLIYTPSPITLHIYEGDGTIIDILTSEIDSITYTLNSNLPVILTNAVNNIDTATATGGGNILGDGGASIISRGICYSTNPNPTIADDTISNGSGLGAFSVNLTNLVTSTTYYVIAYATNANGIGYGNQVSFVTPPVFTTGSGVVDFDGNLYSSIILNGREWMGENLKTIHYSNGDSIPNITDDNDWGLQTSGAWCYYNNDSTIDNAYGKLYNGYTVMDVRNVCPTSWHVPTSAEWDSLNSYLTVYSGDVGGQLKEIGLSHWLSPNYGASNTSDFTALPGGVRRWFGLFENMGSFGTWWSSTAISTTLEWRRLFNQDGAFLPASDDAILGYSIRCIKD